MIAIERYSAEYKNRWNEFVKMSKNGTFLFLRDYMDYHSDRFNDFSLIATKNGKIIALLPANISGDAVYSHRGLTYGGWITCAKGFTVTDMLDVWVEMQCYLQKNGVKYLIYKPVPHIYHITPAEEDLYALFRSRATVEAVLISSTVDLLDRLPFDQNSKRGLKYCLSAGVEVKETDDFKEYWDILSDLLGEKYGVKPVHTLDEIERLHKLFPENIRLVAAYNDGKMVGGTVLYVTNTVVHAQYIATTQEGRDLKVLPAVFEHIIRNMCDGKRYFDLGTSNEDGGNYLNEGLIRQKCGLGGRGVVYCTYKVII